MLPLLRDTEDEGDDAKDSDGVGADRGSTLELSFPSFFFSLILDSSSLSFKKDCDVTI